MDKEDRSGFEKFLNEEKELGKKTIAIYLFYYDHFEPLKLSEDYIHEFIVKHKNTPPVRAFVLNYLLYKDINPDSVKFPQKSTNGNKVKKLIRIVSPSDIEKLKQFFYSRSFKHGLVFDFLYQGALRRAEVPTIRLGSFKWELWLKDTTKFCRLVILGKGNKERMVLIKPETAEAILNHYIKHYHLESIQEINGFLIDHKDSLLFTKRNGEVLTEGEIYTIIRRGAMKVLGRNVHPHELRHTFADELQKRGVSLLDIKNYLGHTKIATTEIYLHKTGEESLDKIEEGLKV